MIKKMNGLASAGDGFFRVYLEVTPQQNMTNFRKGKWVLSGLLYTQPRSNILVEINTGNIRQRWRTSRQVAWFRRSGTPVVELCPGSQIKA